MCGIITAISKKENVNDKVLAQFQNQISRGTQGFGAVFVNEDQTFKVKRSTDQVKAIVDMNLNESKFIMFHHRYPTSSANLTEQTHPLFISDDDFKHDYLVIHNGVIQNDEELLKEHEGMGFSYKTKYSDFNRDKFNDSEGLAIEIARYLEKETTMINVEGSAAFVCLQIDKKKQTVTNVLYGTNGSSPLKVDISDDEIFLSSTGKGIDVPKNTLFNIKVKSLKITESPLVFYEKEKVSSVPVWSYPVKTESTVLTKPIFGKDHKTTTVKPKESNTVKYYGVEYSKDYFDIIKESREKINEALSEFYEYVQNVTYSNDEEVEECVRKITKALFRAESQAIMRDEDLTAMEEAEEEKSAILLGEQDYDEEDLSKDQRDLLAQEEEELRAWNASFGVS